MTNIYRRH